MTADTLDEILRLVAAGRLTAEEAAPILAALDAAQTERSPRPEPPGGPGGDPPRARDGGGATGQAASRLRIEVREKGRSVVKLRLPIGVGRFALDRVPGLSGEQVSRVREALSSGLRGPVLEIDDDGDGVEIVLE